MDFRVGFVQRDLQVAIAADDGDPRIIRIVEEQHEMTLARGKATTHDLPVVEQRAAEVGGVLAVVQTAHHERPADVAEFEGDQYLVVDLRHEQGAAVRPRAQLGDARPV